MLRLSIIAALPVLFGCQGTKALDLTEAFDRVTAGERTVTYVRLPPDDGDSTNDYYIPTLPGKDVEYIEYYPNGTKRRELRTRRSDVLDVMLGGFSEIEARKFLEDREWRAFGLDVARLVVEAVTQQQPRAIPPAPVSP